MKIIIAAVTVFGAYLAYSDAQTCYSCYSENANSSCANGTAATTQNCTQFGMCGFYEFSNGTFYSMTKGCAVSHQAYCTNRAPIQSGRDTCKTCATDRCNKDGNSASFLQTSFVLLMISLAMSMMWAK